MSAALKNLATTQAALAAAQKALDDERSRRRILCCCGKRHAIRDLDLIVTHYYISPHGCTGGDYWLEGEWNFVGLCGVRNRLLFDDYDVDWQKRHDFGVAAEPTFKRLYRHLFKSRRDEHDEKHSGPNNINYDPDQRRKHFELPEKASK